MPGVEDADRGGDQRTLFVIAGVGHGIASREIVRAIGDDIESADHRTGVIRGEPCGQRGDLDMGIQSFDRRLRAFDLGAANIRRAVQNLTLANGGQHIAADGTFGRSGDALKVTLIITVISVAISLS